MTHPVAPPKQTGLLVTLVAGIGVLLVILVALIVVVVRRSPPTSEVFSSASTVSTSSTTPTSLVSTTLPTPPGPAPTSMVVTSAVSPTSAVPVTPVPTTAVPTTAAPPPTQPARQGLDLSSLSVDGLVPLTMGMSQADATARTGLGSERSQCGDASYLTGVPTDVYVRFTEGRLTSISVKNPSVRTVSGLGVGTSLAELTRKLPSATRKPSPYAQLTLYVFRSQDGARELVFWVSDGSVSSMVVAFGEDGEAELC